MEKYEGGKEVKREGQGGNLTQRSSGMLENTPSQRAPRGGTGWNCRRNIWVPMTWLASPWQLVIHGHRGLSPFWWIVGEVMLEQEEFSFASGRWGWEPWFCYLESVTLRTWIPSSARDEQCYLPCAGGRVKCVLKTPTTLSSYPFDGSPSLAHYSEACC